MKTLLLILTFILATVHAPSLVEVSALADEHRAAISYRPVFQVVGQDQRANGDRKRSDRRTQGQVKAVITGEYAANPKFPTYEKASGTASSTKPIMQQDDCPCGPDCKCPDPMVCKAGDCKKNYVMFFSAEWCAPCKKMYPRINELRDEGYIVYFFDIEKFPDAAEKFKVESIPMTVVMNKGQEVARFIGIVEKDRITDHAKPRDEQESDPFDYNFND